MSTTKTASKRKAVTRDAALAKLAETRVLTTGMLPALGISMDNFLKYAQLGEREAAIVIDRFLAASVKQEVR